MQAIEHFREALFLDSGDADTTVELADALIASGDPLAAVETLQPLLRRVPELEGVFGRLQVVTGRLIEVSGRR